VELRPYQTHLIDQTITALDNYKRVCLCAAVGSGKTVMARAMIEKFISQGKRVAFVVNRLELVKQTIRTFSSEKVSVLKAGFEKHFDASKPIQIIMIQTWHARRPSIGDFDFILIDEFHLFEQGVMAENFLSTFNQAKIIGLTATPITADGFMLENYDFLIDTYRTRDLQALGFLVKDRWYSSPKNLELENVGLQGGEYVESILSQLMGQKKIVMDALQNFIKFAKNKKTIVFAVDIAHAEKLHAEFLEAGFNFEILHSKIDNLDKVRDGILQRFKNGETHGIINVGILTTGFDDPSIECVLLARPTKSLRLYIQMVGRALRIYDGKSEALILDCANNMWEHGLATDNFNFNIPRVEKIRKPKRIMRECPECESANSYTAEVCCFCGFEFEKSEHKNNFKTLNESIVEIDVNGVTVQERGLPDLKHIVKLFFIAKNLNEKTAQKSNKSIEWFINDMYKKYISKFESEGEFFKFLQDKIIVCIRRKHSFYKIMFDFKNEFEHVDKNVLNQLKLNRGIYPEPCPQCDGVLNINQDLKKRMNMDIFHCAKCGMGYDKKILDEKKYIPMQRAALKK